MKTVGVAQSELILLKRCREAQNAKNNSALNAGFDCTKCTEVTGRLGDAT